MSLSSTEGHVKGMLRSALSVNTGREDFWKTRDLDMSGHRVYVELSRPMKDEVFGSAVMYHPVHGKWVCLVKPSKDGLGDLHDKPKQIFTAEQIRDMLRKKASRLTVLHDLFGIPV